jgi:hypothetical protein
MTPEEQRLTRGYYCDSIGKAGNIYKEEFGIIKRAEGSWDRRVDAIVVEGKDPIDDHDLRCLDGRNVTIIQTKVAPLNPWLVGQALLSPRLLARSASEQGWKLGKVTSIALCDIQPLGMKTRFTAGLSPFIERHFTDRDLVIARREVPAKDKKSGSSIKRIPGIAARFVDQAAEQGFLIKVNAELLKGFRVSGIFVRGLSEEEACSEKDWRRLIAARSVVVIHSEKDARGKPRMSAMYMAGEVIAAKLLLTEIFHANSVESVIACGGMDAVVEEELRRYDTSFAVWNVR